MDLTAPAWRSSEGEPVGGEAGTSHLSGSASEAGTAAPDAHTPVPEPSTAAPEADGAGADSAAPPPAEATDATAGGAAPEPVPAAAGTGSVDAAPAVQRRISLRQWIKDHDESWVFVVIYLGLAVGLSVFVSLFWLLAVAGLHLVFELVRQAHYRDGKANVFMHALWEIKLDVGLVLLALMLVLYIEVVLGLLGVQSAARAAAVTRAGARLGSRAAAWERNIRTFLLTVDEMVRIVYAGVLLRRRGRSPEEEAEAALHDGSGRGEGVEAELEAAAREAEKGAERRRKAEKAAAKRKRVEEAMVRRQEAEERKRAVLAAASTARAVAGAGTGDRAEPIAAWRGRWGMADRIGVALVVIGVLLIVAAPYLTPHDWGTATAALLGELRPWPQ